MKKISALFLMLFCLSIIVSAQEIVPIELGVSKTSMDYWMTTQTHTGYEDTRFIYSPGLENGPEKKQVTDYLYTIEAKQNTLNKTLVYRPESFNCLKSFENEDGLVVYYLTDNSKDKIYTLYANVVSKEDKVGKWAPEVIMSIPYEKKENLHVAMSVSPDQTKGMICFIQTMRKGQFKGSKLITFDNQGNTLWEKEVEFNVNNETFGVLDMAIDDAGDVFAAVYSYTEESKNKRNNEILTLLHITENDATAQNQNIDFSIMSGKMKIGQTGNIYVGGYTCSKLSKNEDGTYMVTYEPATDNIKSVGQKQFPDSYHETFPGGLMVGFYPNQTYSLVVRDIYEFSNGTAALLGEQRHTLTIQTQYGSTTYFFVRNVVYSQTNTSGEIENLTFFDRKAVAGNFPSIMYYPMFDHDKIYVLYADHVSNYAGKEGFPFKRLLGGDKKYCCSLLTINNTGNGETQKLFDVKQMKKQIIKPLFIEDDGFIVLDSDKKGTNISKLKVGL